MERELENTSPAHEARPDAIVLRFDSQKTVGEVYEYTIDSIDKAFDAIIALGSPELCQQAESRLKDFVARLHNAQYQFRHNKVVEGATFEELQAKQSNGAAWTIVNGKRVTLDELEGGK